MARHTMYTFKLHRRGVIVLLLLAVLLCLLAFFAGYLTGERPGGEAQAETADAGEESPASPAQPGAVGDEGPANGEAEAAGGEAGGKAGGKDSAPPPPTFALRVDAFLTAEEAQARVQDLTDRGLQPAVVKLKASGGGELFQVLIGSYPDREEALTAAEDFFRQQGERAVVVVAPAAAASPVPGPSQEGTGPPP